MKPDRYAIAKLTHWVLRASLISENKCPQLTRAATVVHEEGPWTVAAGELRQVTSKRAPFRPDGVEALTYDNVFGQPVEQVWFDGKVVYALDLGEVDVDSDRVKVAQEYQIVYAVE